MQFCWDRPCDYSGELSCCQSRERLVNLHTPAKRQQLLRLHPSTRTAVRLVVRHHSSSSATANSVVQQFRAKTSEPTRWSAFAIEACTASPVASVSDSVPVSFTAGCESSRSLQTYGRAYCSSCNTNVKAQRQRLLFRSRLKLARPRKRLSTVQIRAISRRGSC